MAYEYIENFKKFGFGLFIHFGLYSVLGKGEWAESIGKIDREEYESITRRFVIGENWAKDLVRTAKEAGCRYITLTTRHHDGFSLYDTKGLNDFDAPHSACGRDLIAEFVEACREGGVVPFFYHTLLDWHNSDYANDFPKYIDYLDRSIEILCSSYGKIGGFWFDGMWDKPDADWQEDRLYGTIRKFQPEAMIINNTGLSERGQTGHREIDSVTFERGKPFCVDTSCKPIAGEVCEGITDHWGYCEEDVCFKSVPQLTELLVDCRKYGHNLLLNTGLRGDGSVNPIEREILKSVGKVVRVNRNVLLDARPCGFGAENADLLTDGKYYYAVVKKVPMFTNVNVTAMRETRRFRLKTERKILSAEWMDNGEKAEVTEDGDVIVAPFSYGYSYGIRIAKIILEEN